MIQTKFISAICTPLTPDETLCREGLEAHLEEQWTSGIAGVLVAGTMGLMQLQSDRTYRELVEHSVKFTAGRGEVLVGVGDTSFVRTCDRIRLVEQYAIDGVVVVTPYLWKYTIGELVDYYHALADVSTKPVFLYDLPGLTGVKLDFDTVTRVAHHPNIAGIKCSGEWSWTRQLIDRVGDRLRVIPAQPHVVDELIRVGVTENLDGIYAVAPQWTVEIALAAEHRDWKLAAKRQQRLSSLLQMVLSRYPLLPACSAILNARGVAGNIAPRPITPLTPQQRESLLNEPLVRELIATAASSDDVAVASAVS